MIALDRHWLIGAVFMLIVYGCASTAENRILSADEQYAQALDLYEREKYIEAVSVLQAFSFNYPQDPRVEDARWLTAEAYYGTDDWATAAQEYLGFQRDFPRSEQAPAALYQAGRSYERLSLRPELDQRDTERAINMYERLTTEYPASDFDEEAREKRRRLRNKLAEKTYLNAEFYFDNKRYEAAEIYLVDLIEKYPDSDWLAASYSLLAETFCKQGLRDRASELYTLLFDTFPDSDAASEIDDRLPSGCRVVELPAAQLESETNGR
ncbi:MAG: outer membrane protein assembly factor BamD [Gemmatimonadota bacterium]